VDGKLDEHAKEIAARRERVAGRESVFRTFVTVAGIALTAVTAYALFK
jgi:hypothetical protein